ncbi:MAG: hypothetical protein D6719_12815 [Candidatus Dadabacteria bacterium]|nr:MAG: hypothetical protein D6719_12815 [Candidatus Dadabacteria bacterium]
MIGGFKLLRRVCNIYLIITFALLLCGCTTGSISPAPLPEAVLKLASSSQRPIGLSVKTDINRDIRAYQYAFIVVPLGAVALPSPVEYVSSVLYRELALSGYRPITYPAELASGRNFPLLEVNVEELNISGFDLFVTRRVRATVKLSGKLINREGNIIRSAYSQSVISLYRRYAFKPELEGALMRAVNQAASDLLSKIGI